MSFLQLNNLVKRYGDFTAVEEMHLSIEKGEFVSLLGPSGCGKTTTLQMIAGFTDPSEGSIAIEGRDITNLKPNQRGLGIVFQTYALFPHMTVGDNVRFGLEMRNVSKPEIEQRVAEVLELVHLMPFMHRFPKELSGGQRQRVALARALVIKPDVLLLDEPLSNLDAKLREGMQLELREIQRTLGTTTILVTHDQSEALAMSDRIAVMDKGKLIQVDEPLRAYEYPSTKFVSNFLGKTNNLHGKVVSRDAGRMTVSVSDGNLEVRDEGTPVAGEIELSIRPEKLYFTDLDSSRIQGKIHNRVFLGNHFMFQIDTAVGRLLLTMANGGGSIPGVNDIVGLGWSAGEIRILKGEA